MADFLAGAATLTDAQAKAIPARRVARFFRIDSKLDAIVRADVSRQIPLVP